MIGIIGAMDVEVNNIKNKIQNPIKATFGGAEYVCGFIDDVQVCVAMCSPGKVNAALCAQAMIDNFDVDEIINVGVGCSLNKNVVIKNIVVADAVVQYDMDMTAIGEPLGFIEGINTVEIKTDKTISDKLARIAINSGEKIHRGTIASGDKFIASVDLKNMITENFGAICGEMEGGAIGHVCLANKIPFSVLRSISDGGDEDAQMDFPTFKEIAAEISTKIILQYISEEKTQISL